MNLANCAGFNLPITAFDDCDPKINLSEIERIFVGGPKAAAFSNIASEAEWNSRLSQSTVGVDTIRALTVIGDFPAAAGVTRQISNGRTKQVGKDYTLNYTVDDMPDENYLFFQFLDEEQSLRLFAFETQGGKMYHFGNAGILVSNQSNNVLARGRDETEVENGVITWRRSKRPTRIDSPIFEGEETTPLTFDSSLVFDTDATPGPTAGVSAVAGATDAEQKFEFNAITPQVGTPMSMSIEVSSVEEVTIDYTSDYNGSPFKYTDKAGTIHTGSFTNGTVNF